MASTCDSEESIATPPPDSDLDDDQIRALLASPLVPPGATGKCGTIASLSLCKRKLDVQFISGSAKNGETQCVVQVFSVAHEIHPVVNTSLNTRETGAHRTQDVTTPSTTTTTPRRVGSLPQGHPGLWGTPVGPGRTPTIHRCLYGGRLWVARRNLHEDDQRQQTTGHRQASRQTCLQWSGIEKREQSYCWTWILTRSCFQEKTSWIQKRFLIEKIFPQGINRLLGNNELSFRFSNPQTFVKSILEDHRDHMLAEVRSEIMKQECKVVSLNTCTRELQRQAHSQRLELDEANCGNEESRREQDRSEEELALREKALRNTRIRNIHEMDELRRVQKMRVDEFSLQKFRERHAYNTGAHFTDTGFTRKGELYEWFERISG